MHLEPRLRAFAAVVREGSFSRAAESLFISQPAVSRHIAALEAELGQRLLHRTRVGATATPAGKVVADYVLRAEALLAGAERALAADAEPGSGVLAVAASGIPGTYVLPPLVASFHDRYPGVEIRFDLGTSGEALEAVRLHRVELAVVGGMTVPAELDAEQLLDDQIVLIGSPAQRGHRFAPRDLEVLTWISREEGSSTRAAVEAARWQLGFHPVRTLELPSWEAVKLAVAAGGGIAAISRLALAQELQTGSVVTLDVPRWRLTRAIALVSAGEVPLSPPADRFRSLLRSSLAARPG